MTGFFGDNQPGTWVFSSASDSRWNGSGRVEDLVISAGMPADAKSFFETKKAELGDLPGDLHFSMYKD